MNNTENNSRLAPRHWDAPVVIPAAQAEEIAVLLLAMATDSPSLLQRADALLLANGLQRRIDALLPVEERPAPRFVSCPTNCS